MLQNCLIFLPIVPLYARFLRRIVPSRTPPPEPSFLRPELLATPEQALAAFVNTNVMALALHIGMEYMLEVPMRYHLRCFDAPRLLSGVFYNQGYMRPFAHWLPVREFHLIIHAGTSRQGPDTKNL